MLFAIDIDGTIAIDRVGYAHRLNEALDLRIPEDIIDACTSYYDFAALLPVLLYRQDNEQNAHYQALFATLEHDPDIQRQLAPMPGAVAALKGLAESGRIIYVTCRKPEAEALTRQWLTHHGFPHPETATTCEHYGFKYLAIHDHALPHEHVILIDDRGEMMLKAFMHLARISSDVAGNLVGRFALITFGTDEKPSAPFTIPFPVFALPSWQPEDLARLDEEAEQTVKHSFKEKKQAIGGQCHTFFLSPKN